ncbi:MAG TPA: hypothetical protein VFM08_16065 [Nocardioides sp.]|jgi:hypothetical protein|nr:hypothetical protein [Nocardioides sp.]
MTRLSTLGRTLSVLGLLVATIGLGVSSAEARDLARACRHPVFVTSGWEGHGLGRYYADSDMWNAAGYDVSQTMRVCSPGNWSVRVKADNKANDGAVKTYPNVHRDYHDWGNGHEPRLSAFRSISSKFASRSPGVGIYNGAYDIWINGVADSGSTELMIWTDNHRQVPSGRVVERGLKFSHRTWKLWAADNNHYLAFVANKRLGHGKISLKKRFAYLTKHGYLPQGSTLGQVCFGYEIVSTKGTFHKFKIDRFSVTSSRK